MIVPETEFSRRVAVDSIPARGTDITVTANPEECEALARRFGLQAIGALTAELRLKALAGGTLFRVKGRLTAEVVQTCVVTLDPLPATVEEEFDLTFGAGSDDADAGGELDLSFEDDDPPEALVDGAIDVGEAVAEQLALALDPFPRREGAMVAAEPADPALAPDKRPNPFAALAGLRKKMG
ncbi:DUF177 domain-containing protein [Magnetospirillum sp. UT-4]|uniref:YceD family protein n=1 Tax=Magnetospirillum sp. UT-4 TaxID=2681467 RepID=UPI001382CF0F|nr:DUF177 domain-containing protein [Magnetospirillum sp. UT-4]CAA7617843.1 conserved hypothetical protein [Magnetospirillum sp. UT-4]